MAKAKRYDEGGVAEGKNAGIDDDTRARAMKYVQEQSEKGSEDESSGEKTVSRATSSKVSTKPAAAKAEMRGVSMDDEAGMTRGRPAEGAPKGTMGANPPRNRTRAELLAAIPTGGRAGAGPTAGNGNSVEGSELSRNVKNTLNALGPTRLAGLGNAAAEGLMATRAAKAAEAAAETAKAAKVAKAAKATAKTTRAAREAKTLNPNAWMAGPKGMKDDFKKGGSVKGWGISRGARAAKVY